MKRLSIALIAVLLLGLTSTAAAQEIQEEMNESQRWTEKQIQRGQEGMQDMIDWMRNAIDRTDDRLDQMVEPIQQNWNNS